MRVGLVAFLACAVMLAGCSGSGGSGDGDELVVSSTLPDVTEVGSEGEPQKAAEPPKEGTRGHIAGFVVSDTIRPIEGARIALPGMDLEQVSDRDGSFGFVDLRPGPYFVTVNATGYYPAEAELDVEPDAFSRVKFVLTPIPPPEPYHFTQVYYAQADAVIPFYASDLFCYGCTFPFYLDQPAETVVIEAVTDTPEVGFYLRLYEESGCCYEITSTTSANPLRFEVPAEVLLDRTGFSLGIYPESLVPTASVSVDIYVTPFYNQPNPAGWSFVNGDE